MIKCLARSGRLYFSPDQSEILSNGSLFIKEMGWVARGQYECLAYDDLGRFQSLFFNVSLELDFRSRLYYVSLVYAVLTAGGFLLLTLFFKFIFWVTHK